MTTGWSSVRLGDLVHVKHGYAFSGMAEDSDRSKPVVVGIGNFDYAGGFRFDSTTVKRYDRDFPQDFELRPGDLLLAMTCQTADGEILGIPGRVPDDDQTYLHNQRLGKVEVLDPSRFDLDFAFQLARWETFNRHLFITASGSKILHTSPTRIEDFVFDLPPLTEQRDVAATLGALDDKIESNRRTISHAEALLDATGEQASGSVPETPLGSLASIERATVNPKTLGDQWVDHFSLPAFDVDARPERSLASAIMSNKIGLTRPSILVSRLNPRINRTWWARPSDDQRALASTEFAVLTADSDLGLAGVWLAVRDAFFRQELPRRVTGTSGSHQRVRPDDLLSIPVPDVRALDPTTKATALSLLQLVQQRRNESARLTALRDALLPELLSGRIRVPEAAAAAA